MENQATIALDHLPEELSLRRGRPLFQKPSFLRHLQKHGQYLLFQDFPLLHLSKESFYLYPEPVLWMKYMFSELIRSILFSRCQSLMYTRYSEARVPAFPWVGYPYRQDRQLSIRVSAHCL